MNQFSISGYLTALLTFLIACFVLSRNYHKKSHIFFFLYSTAITCWSFLTATHAITKVYAVSLFCAKAMHLFVPFIPVLFCEFVATLIAPTRTSIKKIILFGYVSALFLAFFTFSTRMFVSDVVSKLGYDLFMSGGPWYFLMISHFVFFTIFGLILILANIRFGSQRNSIQLQYLFYGSLLGYSLGASCFLPVYNITIFPYPYGSYAICAYVFITAYAIVKHRLMDIEVVIKRTLIFAGLTSFIFGVFAFVTFLVKEFLSHYLLTGSSTFTTFISVVIIVVLYDPLRNFLINVTDRYLFQKKYDYHKLLKENAKQIAFIHSLDEVAKQVSAYLVKQGRIRNAALFMRSTQNTFELKYPLGYGGRLKRPKIELPENHYLLSLLRIEGGPITVEALQKKMVADKINLNKQQEVNEIINRLKVEALIPSFIGRADRSQGSIEKILSNVLVLGTKKSDKAYTNEDLDVFFTVAQESAIAAENARLMDENLMEREARLKAESEARLATYSKSNVHESKNALAGLYGPAQFMTTYGYEDLKKIYERFLKDKIPSTAEKKFLELMEAMKQKGELIFTKADELLVIAKTGEGTLLSDEGAFGEFNFKMVWDAAKIDAKTGECKLIREVPDKFHPYGNIFLIKRVLINLMNNAAEAMKYNAKGEIMLRGRYDEIEGMRVTFFEFSDNGPGIPSDTLKNIWNQGFSTKLKPLSSDIDAPGRGQGLWVCKDTIENIHGGKIWVESEEDKGTVFKFWLPFKDTDK